MSANDETAWCWTCDLEAEFWNGGGSTREECLADARADCALEPKHTGPFWIAPTFPATESDVQEYWGDDEVEVGSPIIDTDKIEQHTP